MKKFVILLALGTLIGSTAFATANNCGTGGVDSVPGGTTNPSGFSTLATVNDGDGSDLGNNAGCQVINKVFDNFSTLSTSINNPTNISIRGTDPVSPAGVQQRLEFSSAAGGAWSDTGEETTSLWFLVTPFGGSGSLGPRQVGILGSSNFGGSDDITIQIRACFDSVIVCTLANGGYQYNQSFTFTPSTLTAAFAGFSSLQTDPFTVRITITTDNNSGMSALSLTDFYVEFADTPEPSTFGMMAVALAGLGFLARRRRGVKQA